MQKKSSQRMTAIKEFVDAFYRKNRTTPSIQNIADGLGIGKATVFRYLHAMNENGMLQYSGTEGVTTSFIQKARCDSAMVAVLGRVSCGLPKYADEDVETYVEMPRQLLGEGTFFLLRAKGDSMIGAGIDDGDLVLIRQQNTAENGDIVVALMGEEATLKTYYLDREQQCIRLHPENDAYQDIVVQEALIQGVAVKILKDIPRPFVRTR